MGHNRRLNRVTRLLCRRPHRSPSIPHPLDHAQWWAQKDMLQAMHTLFVSMLSFIFLWLIMTFLLLKPFSSVISRRSLVILTSD